MESMLLWGLEMIRSVQSCASPALTTFMKLITNLGAAPIWLALLPLIFWCVDEEKGLRLSLAVLISLWINLALKYLLVQPRPFWEGWDPSVGMIQENFNGFPSGHAQISLTLLVIIASWTRKKWAFPVAIFISLLVGFSRVYLGVHFPTDVLGGWILGALTLSAYFLLGDRIKAVLIRGGQRLQMILCSVLAFFMILYRPQVEMLMPGALVLGLGLGSSLNYSHVGFRAAGIAAGTGTGSGGAVRFLVMGLRFVMGMVSLIVLFMILGRLAPEEHSPFYPLFFFVRLALAGFWICPVVPWLFLRLRLAATTKTAAPDSPQTQL